MNCVKAHIIQKNHWVPERAMGCHVLLSALLVCIVMHQAYAQVCTEFGRAIEGAAVDKQGNFYAVNGAGRPNAIAAAAGTCGVVAVVDDQPNTNLNSLRVMPNGAMLSSDTFNARVVQISPDRKTISTWCYGGGMVMPNDLTVSRKGWVYVSGQRWADNNVVGDGGVWLCKGPGQAQQLFLTGRTNGIELSPDEKYLYVSEAFNHNGAPNSNKILRFTLNQDGTLGEKSVFRDLAADGSIATDVDGMRADMAGNLYVTRYNDAKIELMSPEGQVLKTFQLPFAHLTNLELGGTDGKTLVVVGGCGPGPVSQTGQPATKGCVEMMRVDGAPGRAWSMLQEGLPQWG